MTEQEATNVSGYVYILTIDGMPERVLIGAKPEWPEIHTQLVFGDEDGEDQYELGYAEWMDDFAEFYSDFETEFEEQRLEGDDPLYEMDLDEALAGIERIRRLFYVPEGGDTPADRGPWRLLQLDDALSQIIGAGPLVRAEIVTRLWQYIKVHGLQDKKNKRLINSDDLFMAVFEKEQLSMSEMTKIANTHLR
jgi:hypothetical protein